MGIFEPNWREVFINVDGKEEHPVTGNVNTFFNTIEATIV